MKKFCILRDETTKATAVLERTTDPLFQMWLIVQSSIPRCVKGREWSDQRLSFDRVYEQSWQLRGEAENLEQFITGNVEHFL